MAGTFASRIGIGCSFGGTSQVPSRSLDLESTSSMSLELSDANFGSYDLDDFAVSVWAKPESFSGSQGTIFAQYTSSQLSISLGFISGGSIRVDCSTNGTAATGSLVTTDTYSTGTWYHIYFVWDGQNATAGDRMRLYVDGVEVVSFSTETNPPQSSLHNSTAAVYWGNNIDDSSFYDGLIYQPATFSGTIPAVGSLISGGSPVDIQEVTGLYSLLQTTASSTLEDDEIIATNWTNNNTVVKSTDVPT